MLAFPTWFVIVYYSMSLSLVHVYHEIYLQSSIIFVFVGQLVTSEVLMASESGCPIEMHKIVIDQCDEMYDKNCTGKKFMPFYRAWYDHKTGQSPNSPREQVSSVTYNNGDMIKWEI